MDGVELHSDAAMFEFAADHGSKVRFGDSHVLRAKACCVEHKLSLVPVAFSSTSSWGQTASREVAHRSSFSSSKQVHNNSRRTVFGLTWPC